MATEIERNELTPEIEAALKALAGRSFAPEATTGEVPPVEAAPELQQPEPQPPPEQPPQQNDAAEALRRQIEALNQAQIAREQAEQQAAIAQQAAHERRQAWLESTPGAKDHREALGHIHRAALEAAKGSHVDVSKVTVTEHVTQRIDQWEASGEITARTAARYRELLTNQIVPFIGAMLVQKIRPMHVEQWHTDLRTKGRADGKGGLAPRTIGHAHRVLSSALNDAAANELVLRNVMAGKSPPKVPDTEMVIVRDVPAFIAKIEASTLYVPAMVSLFTGMRRNEVLALRWGRVDLDKKVIQVREALEFTKAHGIRFKTPKSKAGRRDLTLPDVLVDVLRNHRKAQLELRVKLGAGKLQDDALLFTDLDGAPLSPNAISAAWSDYAERIGMPEVTFHGLRHTHASQLIDAGVDIVTISKRLGHAKPDITLRIYAHLFARDDGKAAAAINATLK